MEEAKYILLAEDNAPIAELLLLALAESDPGTNVAVVLDGAEALDFLYCRGMFQNRETGHPAVLLLDLKMPRVDGLGVLRQIKSDQQLKMIPVVMLTSSRDDRDLLQSYQLGANAYVVKPVDFKKFLATIKQVSAFWMNVNESPFRSHGQTAVGPPPASVAASGGVGELGVVVPGGP